MSKTGTTKTGTTEKPDPWRVPVAVAQIPETGLHRDIEADQADPQRGGRCRRLA